MSTFALTLTAQDVSDLRTLKNQAWAKTLVNAGFSKPGTVSLSEKTAWKLAGEVYSGTGNGRMALPKTRRFLAQKIFSFVYSIV